MCSYPGGFPRGEYSLQYRAGGDLRAWHHHADQLGHQRVPAERTSMFGVDLTFAVYPIYCGHRLMVQLVEMVVEKFSPGLHAALGIFLPLITVNCAIPIGSLFMVSREYNFQQLYRLLVWAAGSGWFLAIIAIAPIREKKRYSNVTCRAARFGHFYFFILTG